MDWAPIVERYSYGTNGELLGAVAVLCGPWLTNPCWAVTFPERPGRSVAAMGGVRLLTGPVPATAGVPGLAAACGGGQAAPAVALPAITARPARGRS
jgi:hypothetical protein